MSRVRQQNLELERQHQAQQELVNEELNSEEIQLGDDFFYFNTNRISDSVMRYYEDENILVQWYRLKKEVDSFFMDILKPAQINAPVADADGRAVRMADVSQNYINQIASGDNLNRLYTRSIQLGMDKIQLDHRYKDFGIFTRLNELVQIRNQVFKDLAWCQSTIKQYLWKPIQMLPKVEKGDACLNYLQRSISKCISIGLFLRQYRTDKNAKLDFHAKKARVGMIIDFRNEEQREDYLNMNSSEFVDPELQEAERYLQEKIRVKEAPQQLLAERRLREAQAAQPGGRVSRRQRGGRLNSKINQNKSK